jgi:phenylacetate-CoA ligase
VTFLRYAVGDYLQVSEQRCPCGRTHLAIGEPAGRPDDMVKVRGVVLFPSTIEAVVRLVPELTNEFLMVLTNEAGMDDLAVHVEATEAVASESYGGLAGHVQERIRTELGLRTTVQVLTPRPLPHTEFKAKRIKDLPTEDP